jgi:hypothetical protein
MKYYVKYFFRFFSNGWRGFVSSQVKRFSDQKLENLAKPQQPFGIHVQRILGAFQQLFIVSQNFSFIRVKKKSILVKVLWISVNWNYIWNLFDKTLAKLQSRATILIALILEPLIKSSLTLWKACVNVFNYDRPQ